MKNGTPADVLQHRERYDFSNCYNSRNNTNTRIRTAYKEVVVCHPLLAASKNVDNILWKQCFYKRIEQYRKRIRQFTATSPTRPTLVSTPNTPTKPTTSLFQLGNDLSIFIAEAKAYYQSLLLEVNSQSAAAFLMTRT